MIEALRDFFEPGGSDKLCRALRREVDAGAAHNAAVMEALLALARTVARSENNKGNIYIA